MGIKGKPVSAAEVAMMWRWWKRLGTVLGVARVAQRDPKTVRKYLRTERI